MNGMKVPTVHHLIRQPLLLAQLLNQPVIIFTNSRSYRIASLGESFVLLSGRYRDDRPPVQFQLGDDASSFTPFADEHQPRAVSNRPGRMNGPRSLPSRFIKPVSDIHLLGGHSHLTRLRRPLHRLDPKPPTFKGIGRQGCAARTLAGIETGPFDRYTCRPNISDRFEKIRLLEYRR